MAFKFIQRRNSNYHLISRLHSTLLVAETPTTQPEGPEELLRMVRELIAKGEMQAARILVTDAVSKFPTHKGLLETSGDLHLRLRNPYEATKAYQRALELDPTNEPIAIKLKTAKRRNYRNTTLVAAFLFGFPILSLVLRKDSPQLAFWLFASWSIFLLIVGLALAASGQLRFGATMALGLFVSTVVAFRFDVIVALAVALLSLPFMAMAARLDARAKKEIGLAARLLAGTLTTGQISLGYEYSPLLRGETRGEAELEIGFPGRVRINRPYPLIIKVRSPVRVTLDISAPDCVPTDTTYAAYAKDGQELVHLLIPKRSGSTIVAVHASGDSGDLLDGRQILVQVRGDPVAFIEKYLLIISTILGMVALALGLLPTIFH